MVPAGIELSAANLRPGDRIIVKGGSGSPRHRGPRRTGELDFETDLLSDCRPLGGLAAAMLAASLEVRTMRDVTRDGLAAVLEELAICSSWRIEIDEEALPLRPELRGAAELAVGKLRLTSILCKN